VLTEHLSGANRDHEEKKKEFAGNSKDTLLQTYSTGSGLVSREGTDNFA
jgi:hypothetical protein